MDTDRWKARFQFSTLIVAAILLAVIWPPRPHTAAAQETLREIIPRIINGVPTTDFESVGIVGSATLGGFCTGVLISPRHVLTAAHCAEVPLSPTDGTFEIDGEIYATSAIFVHPDYDPDTAANDIAIFELSEPVPEVTPSPINLAPPAVGDDLFLVGFGGGGDAASGDDGTFGQKRVGVTPIDFVEETLIIWIFDGGDEANTGFGDSGGPAFLEVEGQFLVAAITSGGTDPNAALGDIAFNTRVDAFADWIVGIVETAPTPGAVDTGGTDTMNPQDPQGGEPIPPSNAPGMNCPDARRPDARRPDARRPDPRRPDARRPDARRPDPRRPDVRRPGARPGWRRPNAFHPGHPGHPGR